MDYRNIELAKILVNYSVSVNKGDKVLIHYSGNESKELVIELIKKIYEKGGLPFLSNSDSSVQRELLMNINEEQLNSMAKYDSLRMKDMNCYIGINGSDNCFELSDVPQNKMLLYSKLYQKPVHVNIRVQNTKWVILIYPNKSFAQLSKMPLDKFNDFYYKVCTLDYKKMGIAMQKLINLMNKTDKVRIKGKDTDINFSIKGINAVPCAGKMNIPDGEIYTAPVKNSVNGRITYNTMSTYNGFGFENVSFEFKNGKIINATANNSEKLNSILDTDEGSRYIGEFAFGVNPYINEPMNNILFDEKINGSIHFTPGSSYKDAYNGNESSVHWDLVLIQRESYGGGEIYFDNVLIRRNGLFVLKELEDLNPKNLI